MVAATGAYITPDMLRWARERIFPTVEIAADHFRISAEKWKAWESGDARPTFRQAQMLADRLHVPFGYLYLSERPKEEMPLPDLRTVRNERPQQPSADFFDLLTDTLAKQEWYREYQEDTGGAAVPIVARFRQTDAANDVARFMRESFGLADVMRKSGDRATFLREFTRNAEGQGILILRSRFVRGNRYRPLSVKEFRGFAMSDPLAPLVFINAQDVEQAQIFTLAHELAHVLLGVTGISKPEYRQRVGQQGNPIESLCDLIAVEALMPRADFLAQWRDADSVATNLHRMTTIYRTGVVASLRRAHELNKISTQVFSQHYESLTARPLQTKTDDDDKESGGNPYATLYVRSSRRLVETVIEAVSEGNLGHLEASRLLNIRVQTLSEASRRLFGVPV